jgi:LuxR family glucitol operon transcriptional activator
MAHSIQRLTIFALLSALEIDLRDFLELYIVPAVGEAALFNTTLRAKCADRFRHNNHDATPDVNDLIDYLDLGDTIQLLRANDSAVDAPTRTYLKRYYLSLDAMIPIRNRVMHSRPLEFDDLMRVSELSRGLTTSHRSLWANLRTNIRSLDRDPEYAATLTIPELADEAVRILHNLPQPEFDDTGFMGREKEVTSLKKALAGTYPIVTVVGEGGQGKTALALKVCYDLLDDNQIGLDAIVWTSAKTAKLTVNEVQLIEGAITSSMGIIESAIVPLGRQTGTEAIDDLIQHLANNKILLIIDNLETD